jgi:hypothetical protein
MPTPTIESVSGDDLPSDSHPTKVAFKSLSALLLAPLLLAITVVGFVVVLADFAWFRLRELRSGHPEPKGLWEF